MLELPKTLDDLVALMREAYDAMTTAHGWRSAPLDLGGIEIKVWLRGARDHESRWGMHPTLETAVAAWRERRSDEAPNGRKLPHLG